METVKKDVDIVKLVIGVSSTRNSETIGSSSYDDKYHEGCCSQWHPKGSLMAPGIVRVDNCHRMMNVLNLDNAILFYKGLDGSTIAR